MVDPRRLRRQPQDFETEGVGSFEELDQRGMLYLRSGSNGIRTYRRFLSLMAERYYSLVREVIRTWDPRGLVLGDRYQSFYYPEVVRASASSVDADSSNLNAAWNDGMFPRFYLDTLHALSGRPVFVSEFYMAAQQNRSGNKNDVSTFPTVTTQKERAAGFRAHHDRRPQRDLAGMRCPGGVLLAFPGFRDVDAVGPIPRYARFGTAQDAGGLVVGPVRAVGVDRGGAGLQADARRLPYAPIEVSGLWRR